MKYFIGMCLGVALIVACGSAPYPIHEYILDVKAQVLRGPKEKDDKPISFCEGTICYVYEDADIRKVKQYVVELETRLKDCQKK